MTQTTTLTIKFKTADKKLIFQYESDLLTFLQDYLTTQEHLLVNLKTKKNFFIKAFKRARTTLLRSPHANKNTQESFERVTYTGQIEIIFDAYSDTLASAFIRYFFQSSEQNIIVNYKNKKQFQI